MTRETFDLAFLGFGNVARTFVHQLERFGDRLASLGIATRTIGVATRRRGALIDGSGIAPSALESSASYEPLSGGLEFIAKLTDAARGSIARGRLVLIETTLLNIENGRPAVDHVRAALMAGLHVVTANKGPAAFASRELNALADRSNRALRFESAVMDGIPIFNLVRETLPCAEVLGFRGIVNSTTNFILTEMERGISFDAALAEMQRQGIAEADPSLDIDGWDAAAKTAALANVWLDAGITPHDIERQGIRRVSSTDVQHAHAGDRRLRLVASANRNGGGVAASVKLESLDRHDPLAQLTGMQNAIALRTDILGEVAIAELTAGLEQTAYGLLSDLVSVVRFARRSTDRL